MYFKKTSRNFNFRYKEPSYLERKAQNLEQKVEVHLKDQRRGQRVNGIQVRPRVVA